MRRTNEYTEFGLWLKTELLKRNLTNKEFAVISGLHPTVLSEVLTGKNKSHHDDLRSALEKFDHEQKAG